MKMKKMTAALTITVLTLAVGIATADNHTSQTFTGTYDWSDGDVGDLTAVFESDGDGAWKVKFDFNWNGQDRTWTGTAKGGLEDGTEVSGTATDGNRTWVFEGKIEDGVMSGSHRENREGRKPYESGTFEISR
jgi:hypothetical protein